jgi:EAL domain-containing protein (putative c-di-GMP-specific phosphodiesterase class I)
MAEETGPVVALDRFVPRQACRQMAGWIADAGPLLLHVNLSAPAPAPQRPGGQPGRGPPEQATALAELGCHLAQGFHFSRPA